MVKGFPLSPIRSCLKIAGPFPESLIRIARVMKRGRVMTRVTSDRIISAALLAVFCNVESSDTKSEEALNTFPLVRGLFSAEAGFKQVIFCAKNKG